MHKYDCRNCVCLVGENGDVSDEWNCDEIGNPCSDVSDCPEGIHQISIDDEVKWNDPDNGISSGIYKVIGIPTNEVLRLSNGINEVEAFWYECE